MQELAMDDPPDAPAPKMTVAEFAAKVKAQVPAYRTMDDLELTQKVVALAPDYRALVDLPPATADYPRDARGLPQVTSDTTDEASPLLAQLGPLAHPQTVMDFARLLSLPVDEVRRAAGMALALAAARPVTAPVGQAVRSAAGAVRSALSSLPSGPAVRDAAVGVAKFAIAPRQQTVKFLAAQFVKYMEELASERTPSVSAPAAAPVVPPPTVPPPVVPRPPPIAAPASVPAAAPVVPRPPPVVAPAAARPPITPADLPASWQQFLTPVERGPAFKVSDPLPRAPAPAAATPPVVTPTQAVQAVTTAVKGAKVRLTGEETKAALDLVKRGMSAPDALAAILQQRAFLEQMSGLPTGAQAKAAIKARGYKS